MQGKAKMNKDTRDEKTQNKQAIRKGKGKAPYRKKTHDSSYDTRNRRKDQSSDSASSGAVVQRNPFNDFSWYNRNPALTVAAASLPFPYRPGMTMPVTATTQPSGTNLVTNKIPGGMILAWAPHVGEAQLPTDPINITGMELYAAVRAAFTGGVDADAPDFVIYLLALDSVFSYIAMLKRAFRIVAAYNPQNYYVPEAFFNDLMPYTYQVFAAEKMLLFQRINELVLMTRKFKCPAVFDLFNRHYWMNDNVYADDNTPNSQLYAFQQQYFLQFKVGTNGAGSLTYKELSSSTINALLPTGSTTTEADIINAFFKFGKNMIDALAESDDGYLISGYLKRAYDGVPDFVVDELRWDEQFVPLYVPEVLPQIENSFTVTGTFTPSDITQDPNTNSIISHQKVTSPKGLTGAATTALFQPIPKLSIRSDNPTVIDVVESSRLTAYVDGNNIIHCGTEIPLSWKLTSSVFTVSPYAMSSSFQSVIAMVVTGALSSQNYARMYSTAQNYMYTLALRSMFDWAPRIVLNFVNKDPNNDHGSIWTNAIAVDVWEGHNMTVLSPDVLENIHRMCLFSEFGSFQ